jgi:hypothetical protein
MTGSNWQPLAALEPRRLREARLAAHFAAQWLARAARAYVAPKPDDSHTNLGWGTVVGGLGTHPLSDGSRLGLRLRDLTLMIISTQGQSQLLALGGLADADVRAWLGQRVRELGLDAQKLDAPSPYAMPAFGIATGASYSVDGEALSVLAAWYANANSALEEIGQVLLARGLSVPVVRCWPHHFDLDSLVTFPGAGPTDVRSMGTGFSPGDEYYDAPYFYVSVHPAPAGRPVLPPFAHWHTQDFTAAVATASALLAEPDQHAAAKACLAVATDFAIEQLRGAGQGVGQANSLKAGTALR